MHVYCFTFMRITFYGAEASERLPRRDMDILRRSHLVCLVYSGDKTVLLCCFRSIKNNHHVLIILVDQ